MRAILTLPQMLSVNESAHRSRNAAARTLTISQTVLAKNHQAACVALTEFSATSTQAIRNALGAHDAVRDETPRIPQVAWADSDPSAL